VEEKAEGWRALSPTGERLRRQYRGCRGRGGSVAGLLRSLRKRSSATFKNSHAHLPFVDGEEFIGGVRIVEMRQAREEHV
jgi:hypothetical protein